MMMNKLIPEVGTLFLLLNYKKNNEVKGERTSDSCEHTLNRVIFVPLSLSLLAANLTLGKFQCLIIFLFNHNCVWANSKWGETLYKCRRANITLGENVYIICF